MADQTWSAWVCLVRFGILNGELTCLLPGLYNHQCPVYVACRPDPESMAAFTLSWSGIQFYAFPPFCIIPSMLQKITKDKVQGAVVVPYWPNQPWFPRLASMLTLEPALLSAREDMPQLPMDMRAKRHLRKHLRLLISKFSGFVSEAQVVVF